MRTSNHIIGMVCSVFLLSACSATPVADEASPDSQEPLIGGQRDEHGCLGPAGYSFDEEIAACIRQWEVQGDARRASQIAAEHIGQREGLTVLAVTAGECEGCFSVELEYGENRVEVTLENWEVKGTGPR